MLRARLTQLRDDDQGMSLTELVVGMAILAIFMGIFTTSMLLMSQTVNKVEAVTLSSDQMNTAFLSLDKSIRYAAAISTPAQSGTSNDWNVAYDTTTSGTDVCTQLRIDGTQLQQRTWNAPGGANGTTYSGLTAWTPVADNVTNGDAAAGPTTAPFYLVQPDPNSPAASSFQQLTVNLQTSSGTPTTASITNSMTFTALNSSTASGAATACQQVGVDQSS